MPDRETVIKALHCRAQDLIIDPPACDQCDYQVKLVNRMGCDFRKLCRDVIALLKEQEWHMLTEDNDGIIHGLPGDDGKYFMTDGKDIWIDDYVDGVTDGIILDSGRDIREITAWMYMPELPKMDRR